MGHWANYFASPLCGHYIRRLESLLFPVAHSASDICLRTGPQIGSKRPKVIALGGDCDNVKLGEDSRSEKKKPKPERKNRQVWWSAVQVLDQVIEGRKNKHEL
eukprot:GHVN01106515.1.p2 GENE.GHVN01106515.1~~GHVN01106515.1.p2  ORF type:complete len:103 (-),score=14.08 GHVN01106515.1:111-419(-)